MEGSASAVGLGGPRLQAHNLPEGLLERVALALNSTLELGDVLRLLAEITLEASKAARCSLFLLEDRHLVPTAAIGIRRDERLWAAFRSMSPVRLNAVQWGLLNKGEVIAVEDARSSHLIPADWVERFDLGALVFVPLPAAGQPCGLMVVDWPQSRNFDDTLLGVLQAIGSYAGVAVRNARLFDDVNRRARLQEALARAAGALASHLSPELFAQQLVEAYSELLGARLCAIGLFDEERTQITTIAAKGTLPIRGPLPLSSIPPRIVRRVWEEWLAAKRPLEFSDDPWFADFVGGKQAGATRYVLIPLVVQGRSRGCVLLGIRELARLTGDERSAAEALAAIASAVLERTILLQRLEAQLQQLDALYRLNTALSEGGDAAALIEELNTLLAGQGIEIVGLAFRKRNLSQLFGTQVPDMTGDAGAADVQSRELLEVPMRLGRQAIGTMWVRPAVLNSDQRSFIEALGRGTAEVATRTALRRAVEEAGRDRALGAERERIASDLHDTAGQIFVGVGLLVRQLAEQLPEDSPWKERLLRVIQLADRGKWEIDEAIRALAFVPAAKRGLTSSLRALARSFSADSGIPIQVDIKGRPLRLGSAAERALYRVAREALSNAWRHSRCSVIRLSLDFGSEKVALLVADDGIGLLAREEHGQRGPRFGLVSMRRSMHEAGGSLRIRKLQPHGLVVEARVPRRR